MGTGRGKGAWHLTPEILRGLERGEIDPGAYLTLLMEHIAGLCPECGEGLEAFARGQAPSSPAQDRDDGGRGFLDRAVARAARYHDDEGLARTELTELARLTDHAARVQAVRRGGQRYRNPALVELLLEAGRRQIHDSPEESRRLAELAVEVARRMSEGSYGEELCRDRVAEASAHLANALRAMGDIPAAQRLLTRVQREVAGSFDSYLRAEVSSFAASLARDRRRWREALESLEEASRLFAEIGAGTETVVRVRLKKALILSQCGDPAEAIGILRDLIATPGLADSPELSFITRHNLAFALCDAGRYLEARQELVANYALYEQHQDRSFRLRRRWLEGKIAAGLGRPDEAEAAWLEVRDAFLAAGLGYEAAMVAFELAELFLQAGRTAEVREIALWTTALFEAQDVHREALTAIMLFRQAALRDALSVHELRRAARYLSEVRGNPAARFEAAS